MKLFEPCLHERIIACGGTDKGFWRSNIGMNIKERVEMKKVLHVMMLLVLAGSAYADDYTYSDAFVITVKTDNSGTSANNEFTIPTYLGSSYRYSVDCDLDGVFDAVAQTGDYTCVYPVDDPVTSRAIAIEGLFPQIYFNNDGDKEKIITVEQWGTQQWKSMENAFWGCINLAYVPDTPAPDLFSVNSMASMFNAAFQFNSDIGSWDVSSVSNMNYMFKNALAFNKDISDWNMSNVTYMSHMFSSARSFNQDISGWDVSHVLSMQGTFTDATAFNQDIGDWDVSKVTSMANMFWLADAFSQDIASWDVSDVNFMQTMFFESNISISDYDHILQQWSKLSLQEDVIFGAENRYYCNGATAKNKIQNDFNWIITDAGQNCDFYIDMPYEIVLHKLNEPTSDYLVKSLIVIREIAILSTHNTGSGSIEYAIVGGSDSSRFVILGDTLWMESVQVNNPIDSNQDNIYRVRIRAESGAYSDERTISVKVVNNAATTPIMMYLLQ